MVFSIKFFLLTYGFSVTPFHLAVQKYKKKETFAKKTFFFLQKPL